MADLIDSPDGRSGSKFRESCIGSSDAGGATAPIGVITGLRKAYGATVAVENLDLAVAPGRVLGLVGPNGAGKTTTLSCLAGLLEPDKGSVCVAGRPVSDPRARDFIGIATQEIALYPSLSGRANLRFFSELAGAADSADRVSTVADMLGISNMLDKPVRHLSVGQQRLVHVGAAVVHSPGLVLLDEPTAGLDFQARATILATVRQLAEEGRAVLFSSHYLAEVEQVCDEVVIICEGRVVASGGVRELIDVHGEAYVELRGDGEVKKHPGQDVVSALNAWGKRTVESVTVVRPSLEAVFVRLAGFTISEDA